MINTDIKKQYVEVDYSKKPKFFEIMVVDESKKVNMNNEDSFYLNLQSNNNLLSSPKITDGTKNTQKALEDSTGVRIIIKKTDPSSNSTGLNQAYVITVSGEFLILEKFRLPLIKYLKTLGFDSTYILEDDISRNISTGLYTGISKVESFLRKYIIKFFVIKLGPDWWKITAASDMQKKTNDRKGNEKIFSNYIDNNIYLIDFGNLGEIIYSQSSGNLNISDILNKIDTLVATEDSINNFKKSVQNNYTRFFKETFKDNNFQDNWQELEKIRHKVAHNNLFTLEDQENGKRLISDLINTIKKANELIDQISFGENEKESFVDNFLNSNENIKEETFANELEISLGWASKADGFVGLSNFIKILMEKGYKHESIKSTIYILKNNNKVEIYSYYSDKSYSGSVTSIKLVK